MTLFLADFSVMDPSYGLLVWTGVVFLLVWFFIGKMTFKPILKALRSREDSIEQALHEADKARKEMIDWKSLQEEELKKAREERAKIVKEAEQLRDKIVEAAKVKAEETTTRMVEAAKEEITNRQKEMEQHLFNQVGQMAVNIAEQVLRQELEGKHDAFIQSKVAEFKKQSQANLN